MLEHWAMKALHSIEPERAHSLSLWALRLGIAPRPRRIASPRLKCNLAGLALANPLGLAAGYDKNAVALKPLTKIGFGFIEIGAVTPKAQAGNPRPRFFRLPEQQGAINRFGFNNDGMARVVERLKRRPKNAVIGLNLGANKDSKDWAGDYCAALEAAASYLDFATVNISSPNTENLRELQKGEYLKELLGRVLETRRTLTRRVPIFVKIAPDLNDAAIAEISEIALDLSIDGIIATNTTSARNTVTPDFKKLTGGLSGAPLFKRSTRTLARFYLETKGRIPLIGVGGICNAEDAEAKIKAGASALQIYTALAYQGLSLVPRILEPLEQRLAREDAVLADWTGSEAAAYAK